MGAKRGWDQRRRGLFEEGTKRGGDNSRGGQKMGNQMRGDLRLGDKKRGDQMNVYPPIYLKSKKYILEVNHWHSTLKPKISLGLHLYDFFM